MGVSDSLKIIGTSPLPTMAHAAVAELADALDSKSSGSPRAGSSPASGIATTLVSLVTGVVLRLRDSLNETKIPKHHERGNK